MNSNENNFNEQINEDGQMGQKKDSFGSKVSSFAHNVKDFRDNGGIKGIASDYITSKKNQAKDNIKGKINDKIPESVKQKQRQLQNLKEKADPRKKLDNVKSDLNEKVFRRGVKSAVDAIAPGAGIAAEKMLDVGEGKKAIEAARAADTPTQGLKAGTKELVKIVVTKETKKKILISIIPTLVCFFLVLLIVMTVVNKFNDSKSYAQGGLGGEAFSKIDEKYKAFYENVDKYANGADKLMIVAVLTSYAKNDDYIDMEAEDDNDDGEGNVEISEEINGVTTLSKSKMKKYIKKVAKKINESGSIEKGDYNDSTTGSEFFWWLYEDFVIDYYSNYVTEGNTKKRQEIVNFIYLYYEELKQSISFGGFVSASCPNGVTLVPGNSSSGYNADPANYPIGTFDLEEYVAMVVNGENNSGYDEAMKAQIVAARTFTLKVTNNCTKSITNSTNDQVARANPSEKIKQLVNETAGQVLTYNGDIFLAQYDAFYGSCSGGNCTATYTKLPNNEKHTITVPSNFMQTMGGHGRGMSQVGANYLSSQGKSYEDILKYFYSPGVEISQTGSLFTGGTSLPVKVSNPSNWFNENVSRGYQLGTARCYQNGKYTGRSNCDHLAIDFSKPQGDPIYAIADGTVEVAVNGTTGYGKYVQLGHDLNGDGNYEYYSLYAHQSELLVKQGDKVAGGTQIGKIGSTGNSTGPHLHFELKTCSGSEKKCKIDPYNTLDNIVKGNGIS